MRAGAQRTSVLERVSQHEGHGRFARAQACYASMRHLPKVLRRLPVERREGLFRMWLAWLDQQVRR